MTDKDELKELLHVISWLDKARWSGESEEDYPSYNLSPSQHVLVHWLCYITDRQRAYEQVWERGGKIFAKIIKDYPKHQFNNKKTKCIRAFLNNYRDLSAKGDIKPFVMEDVEPYAPRYGNDYTSIERTLTLLLSYKKDIINFFKYFIKQYATDPNGLVRIAHVADILSYRLEISTPKALLMLKSKEKLDKHFAIWVRTKTDGHKRLWAALRDYRKPNTDQNEPFLNALGDEKLKNLWMGSENFSIKQLELPGDIWNERFNLSLVNRVAESRGIETKRRKSPKSSPQIARLIFDKFGSRYPDYYPEQFDVSFDFVPNMCERKMCIVCPFGENGSKNICFESNYLGDKYCPVALISGGYKVKCKKEKCPIAQEIGRGICKAN